MLSLTDALNAQRIVRFLDDGWEFTSVMKENYFPAKVPGNVYLDLYMNGHITHPFMGTTESQIHWIAEHDWKYRLMIPPDDELINKKNIKLCFDGHDTRADIYMNGILLGQTYNMHVPFQFNVKDFLNHQDYNILEVVFYSPVALSEKLWNEYPVPLPDHPRVMMRKAQYHFGWDWGPTLPTSGIWRPVYFVGHDGVSIEHVHISTQQVLSDKATIACHVTLNADEETEIQLQIICGSDTIVQKESFFLQEGLTTIQKEIIIHQPELWWPKGMGAQHLYSFVCNVLSPQQVMLDQKIEKFGISEISLVEEDDSIGRSFFFQVNGKRVFVKGANYIPAEFFAEQTSEETYEFLIRNAAESNMNMHRVWGGGIYENDIFYDLCDKYGIMVWQDFMFACAMYPFDSVFVENVRTEAVANVVRLRNHPSIALWCGNNEIDEGWHNWGWQKQFGIQPVDSARIYEGYNLLFEQILPEIVNTHDGKRSYWSTSPSTGWGRSEAYTFGDVHYWGVWWGFRPFETYLTHTGRFVSEYGFQALPQLPTLLETGVSLKNGLTDEVLISHQKHPPGFETISAYMDMYAFVPGNTDDYRYISQYIQLLGISTAIEAHRRAMPYCMGTLYWQFNDCWPVVSWSGIDYYGRKKALQHHMHELYSPVMLSITEAEGKLQVWGISDHTTFENASLTMKEMNFKGLHKTFNKNVSLFAGQSMLLFEYDLSTMNNRKRKRSFFQVTISTGNRIISEKIWYPESIKHQRLLNPRIQIEYISGVDSCFLKVYSPVLCRFIELSYEGHSDVFDKNYFDLLPGETIEIPVHSKQFKQFDTSKIRIKTLNDFFIKKRPVVE